MLKGDKGEKSTKRTVGSIGLLWTALASTAYGVCVQLGGKESASTETLLMTAFVTFSAMISAGVIEKFGKK